MLLAKVNQTDEQLTITPMEYVGLHTIVLAVWLSLIVGSYLLALTHTSVHGKTMRSSDINEALQISAPVIGIIVAVIRSKVHYVFWEWPAHRFVFDRQSRQVLRDAKVLCAFDSIRRVSLQTTETRYGWLAFHLVLALNDLKERMILEASVFSLARLFDHNPFAVSHWEPYPDDSLPTNATEYELALLANLIHDYLGLQGPRPCKNLAPSPSPTLNKTY